MFAHSNFVNSGAFLVCFFSGLQCCKSHYCEETGWHEDPQPPCEVKQSKFAEEHSDFDKLHDEKPRLEKYHW